MTWQTSYLLRLEVSRDYYWFVFFSTLCSYNFHWYLTPANALSSSERIRWSASHKNTQVLFYFTGVIGALIYFFKLKNHWFALFFATLLTFLYSAPKIPLPYFRFLKQVAVGKTIFLTAVWTYVTAVLPVFISGEKHFTHEMKWFAASRFFLIYGICILFDYRDRADDRDEGLKTLVNYFDETVVNRLFRFALIAFVFFSCGLLFSGVSGMTVFLIIIPGIILFTLFKLAKKSVSDYLFYLILDGLMMFSALLMALASI
jgi:4-hydroxybenzoate polyprenyltransferase